MTSSRGLREIEKIIKYLADIDKSEEERAAEEAAKNPKEESFEDLSLFEVSKDDTTVMEDDEDDNEDDQEVNFEDFGKL